MTVYKSMLLSTFLYGSESLVCQEKDKGKLNDVTMGYLWSVCVVKQGERGSRMVMGDEWIWMQK